MRGGEIQLHKRWENRVSMKGYGETVGKLLAQGGKRLGLLDVHTGKQRTTPIGSEILKYTNKQ